MTLTKSSPLLNAGWAADHQSMNRLTNHPMITKILVSAAIAVGSAVVGAAPASADPHAIGANPNPFSTLSCNCRETAPTGSPALLEEIARGIRKGLSAGLPGLQPPTQHGVSR